MTSLSLSYLYPVLPPTHAPNVVVTKIRLRPYGGPDERREDLVRIPPTIAPSTDIRLNKDQRAAYHILSCVTYMQ